METLFNKIIEKEKLFQKNDHLLLAVSGGVDSMVLFDLLLKCKYKFIVCYVDHDKRVDSSKDYELVKKICFNNSINFFSKKLTYPEKITNFHDYARNQRYNFFQEVAEKNQIKHILTAHHKDDLIETILLKLERGSNLYGYSGFSPIYNKKGYYFVKPLIFFDKKQIYDYSQKNSILYLEDSTNKESIYKRNIYRNTIIPLLKKENPNVLDKYLSFSKQALCAFTFIRKNTLAFLQNKLSFNVSEFKKLDYAIQNDVLNYILEQFDITCNSKKINLLLSIILSDIKKNNFQRIGNTMYMIKSYDNITFETLEISPNINLTINNLEELQKINNEYIYFSHNKPKNSLKYLKICYNNMDYPLSIRTRNERDYLEFDYGKKKLKKFFIDNKIPKATRDSILLLTYYNKVIGILDNNLSVNNKINQIDGYLVYKQGEINE